MPVVKARLRAVSEHCSLSLNIRHRLGNAEQESHEVLRSLPSEVRVYAAQKIVLSLSGTVNNVQVPIQEVASSQLAINLRDYLQMNADELVLDDIGQPYLDEDSVLISITPQTAARSPHSVMPHLRLHRIDLICSWEIKHSSDEEKLHDDYQPFAKITALSFITMFNDMLSRAVKWQLVRRYPFIFGCWCKQLGVETRFLKSIISSALSIQARSSSCHKPLKEVTRHGRAILRVACSTLDDLGCTASTSPVQRTSSSEALMILMERVIHLGLIRKQFKGTSRIARDSFDNKELMDSPEWIPDGPSLFLDPPDGSSDEGADTVDHALDPGLDDFRDGMHICTHGDDDEHIVPRHTESGPFQDLSFESDMEDLSDKEIPSSILFGLSPPAGNWEDARDVLSGHGHNLQISIDDENLSIGSPTQPQIGQPFQDEDLPFDLTSDLEGETPTPLSSSQGHIRSQVILQGDDNDASLPISRHSSQDSTCDLEDDIPTPPDLGLIDASFWHTLADQEMEDYMADYYCGNEAMISSDQGDREPSSSLRPDRKFEEDFLMEDGDDYVLGFDCTLLLHDYEG